MKAYFVRNKSNRRRRSKKRPFTLGILLLLALTLASSWWLLRRATPEYFKEARLSGQGPAAPDPVLANPRIGVILPLSGDFQGEGEMLRDGISLAWKEMQAKGIRGELLIRDAGKDASEAVRTATQLASDPDSILVLAHLPTAVLSEIVPVYEKAKVPLLVVANSHESLVQHGWIIPFISCDHTEGIRAAGICARWARDGGATVIHDTGPYGLILSAGFREGAEKEGFAVKDIACRADDSSRDALIVQALQGNPSVIWLAGPPRWGAGIIDALMEKGFKGRLFAPQSYGRMIPDDLFGGSAERLNILWQGAFLESERNGMPDFRKTFLRSYLREPDWLAVLGYDALRWAGKAMESEQLTRTKVLEHFLHYNSPGRVFQGVGGELYFDAKGYLQRPFQSAVYRHGKLSSALDAQ